MAKLTPMLAQKAAFEEVQLPALFSRKIDGFRCLVWNGQANTRSMKPMPNRFVREYLSQPKFEGLDGELVVGEFNDPKTFHRTTKELRAAGGEPDFTFWVFDHRSEVDDKTPFAFRLAHASKIVKELNDPRIKVLDHTLINSREEQEKYEADSMDQGFEGTMARSLKGPYKNGRSTMREGYLVKRKTFEHGEGVILGWYELERNTNEAYVDETGAQRRSSKAEGMVAADTLGGFILKEIGTDIVFRLGGGFTMEERDVFWRLSKEDPDQLKGQIVRFKHMPYGRVDAPRIATFDGIRAPEDMSDVF